ncbi:hypothetical protein QAD02_019021 [Eretmocerus hayati]|uniref:Uncharacterized protein n=1 Tax=Eretmocerus hayati TaxID=131215 RepID=A0ACC2PI06_9HYME|nr:hypothetical protein QAD02_019021 [Eretmocerus hayati]
MSSMSEKEMSIVKPQGVEFAIGALAGLCTAVVTNPADVLKTRLQLQNELVSPNKYEKFSDKFYTATLQTARQIVQKESLLALQSGLGPALGLQLIVNGMRLGSYNFAKRHGMSVNEDGKTHILSTAAIAAVSGSLGFVIGSPLYMAKVRQQAIPVFQNPSQRRNYLSTWTIIKCNWDRGGLKGVYRHWNANIPRLFIGSAVQLTTFGLTMDQLKNLNILSEHPTISTFVASVTSGTAMVLTIHPFDVIATRLLNQGTDRNGKSILYSGVFDAISKIFRTEGISGLYKGFFPNWLRLAPYVISCQIFYHKIDSLYSELNPQKKLSQSE